MTDLDWTFEDAPEETQAPEPRLPARRRPPRKWRARHVLLGLAALSLVVSLAAVAYTRAGWRQLETQVAAEAAYEDEQSRAGQAGLVASLQAADNEAWLAVRAAETALGWPAPLPAAHLLPASNPPELLSLRTLGGGVFEASVLRVFADSGGAVYPFALTQRYRNLGPGLWERLPPDTDVLRPRASWQGVRLRAAFPSADLPWMETHLPQVDAALEQACADWGAVCPPDMLAIFQFSSELEALAAPQPPARDAAPPGLGAYPLAFDIAPRISAGAGPLRLTSPHLAGLPQGDDADQALVRALTVSGISFLADVIARPARRDADFFRDALAARAEVRLGISGAPRADIQPGQYLPPQDLWGIARASPDGLAADLPYRLQALAFLDFFLAGQPPSADGALLANRRAPPDLAAWLGAEFGAFGPARLQTWSRLVTDGFERQSTLALAALDGLAYSCHDTFSWAQDEIWRVNGGQVEPLSTALAPGRHWRNFHAGGLAPDGNHLAYVEWDSSFANLLLLDMRAGEIVTVTRGSDFSILGWSAGGQLIYTQRLRRIGDDGTSALEGVYLIAYTRGGEPELLSDQPIHAYSLVEPQWSADGGALAVPLSLAQEDGQQRQAPALVMPGPPVEVQLVAGSGHSPALSRDGRFMAYVDGSGPEANIILLDLNTRAERSIVSARHLAGSSGPPDEMTALAFSPAGDTLYFMAAGLVYSPRLFTIATGGVDLVEVAAGDDSSRVFPAGFSADGRFLAYYRLGRTGSASRLTVLDLHTGARQQYWVNFGGATWSPGGHLLAIGNAWGIYVVDPLSGGLRWLSEDSCQQAVWFE